MNQYSLLDLKKLNQFSNDELRQKEVRRFIPLNVFRLLIKKLVGDFTREISNTSPNPVFCTQLKFRSMTSRWGTCSSKGVITINTKLKNLPLEVIEFVVFHECLHLLHMNHGINFRKRLLKKFPNKKELEHQLKLFGLSEL